MAPPTGATKVALLFAFAWFVLFFSVALLFFPMREYVATVYLGHGQGPCMRLPVMFVREKDCALLVRFEVFPRKSTL